MAKVASNDPVAREIMRQLSEGGLDRKNLSTKNAHVLIPGDDGKLHLLIPADGISGKETKALSARAFAEKNNARRAISVSEEKRLKLGELGEWRDFAISVGEDLPAEVSGEPLMLSVQSVNGDGGEHDGAFFAAIGVDAIGDVFAGNLMVRVVDAASEETVEVTPKLRKWLRGVLGEEEPIGDRVPRSTVAKAYEQLLRNFQSADSAGALGVYMATGEFPSRNKLPEVPFRVLSPQDPAKGLSEATTAALGENGIRVPASGITLEFIEGAIDNGAKLSADAQRELRKMLSFLRAGGTVESAGMNDLLGDLFDEPASKDAEVAAPPVAVEDRRLSLSMAKADWSRRTIEAATNGLGVNATTTARTAELLAHALNDSPQPTVMFIVGPKSSAADRVADTILSISTNKEPVRVARSDNMMVLFGHNDGWSSEYPGKLSKPVLDRHREPSNQHTTVYFENLLDFGRTPETEDNTPVLKEWMARLEAMLRTGKAEVSGGGTPETTDLGNVCFVVRVEGDSSTLDQLLNEPKLRRMRASVVSFDPMSMDQAINYLEQEVAFRLIKGGLPADYQISFSPDFRKAMLEGYKSFESSFPSRGIELAFDHHVDRLVNELSDTLRALPPGGYTIDWSPDLTSRERANAASGEAPFGAEKLLTVEAGGGAAHVPLTFDTFDWASVSEQADTIAKLKKELNIARAKLAQATGKADTV